MLRLNDFLVVEYDQLGRVRERSGNRSQYAGPSNVYRTKDGKWFSMSASAQTVWERLARAMDKALAVFKQHQVSGGPVNDAREVCESEQFRARDAIIEVDDAELGRIAMQNVSPRLSNSPSRVHSAGPTLGEHNDQVLSSLLGLGDMEPERLRETGVI